MYFLSRDVIRYTIPPSHEKKFYNRFTFIKTEIVIGTTPIPAFLPLDGNVIIGISKHKMDQKYVKSNLFRIDMNISRPSEELSFGGLFSYIRSPKIIRKEESPMGFFIGMMFLSIYISQHGDELNFIDVTLLSTLAYMVIGMIIVDWPFRKNR